MSAVDLALELVRLDTINPPGNEGVVADVLERRLAAAGYEVARHEHRPGRPNLIARRAGRDPDRPVLCMTGHMDTVPLGSAPWSVEPFGELRDGRLLGRGSSDMKSGVAAIVVAAERVAELGPPEAGIELVLTAAEETGCEGAIHLAQAGLLGRAGAVLVAEPTGGVPHVAHKGVVFVTARTEGVSAHGSAPHLGRNAIYPLARAVSALADLRFDVPTHPVLGDPTINIGTFAGGTAINVVPDRAEAQIDVRTVPGLTGEIVLDRLRETVGPDVALDPWIDLAPVVTDPGDPWIRSLVELAGGPDEPRGTTYFTDAAALSPAYGNPPTVIWGPGEAAQAHQTDEWAEAALIDEAADMYTEVARRWCQG
jgi:succinyl-diaminopimelate desuccinylase